MFWNKKKNIIFYRVRVDGWLYIHSDDMLTTDITKAGNYESLIIAFNKAKELHHDKECSIIENNSGRVNIRTMDEVVSYLGL
jgi:hypothetical protein